MGDQQSQKRDAENALQDYLAALRDFQSEPNSANAGDTASSQSNNDAGYRKYNDAESEMQTSKYP